MKYLTWYDLKEQYVEPTEINVSYVKETDEVIYSENAEPTPKVTWYGIEWDTEIANPDCTRIGNLDLHRTLPIQSALKGCLVNGSTLNYYLDENDWSKKETGEPSVLDGTDGEVCVQTSKFYGKSEEEGTKRRVMIATTKIADDWIEVPALYIRANRVTVDKTNPNLLKAVSVVNMTANFRGGGDRSANDGQDNSDLGKPRTNLSRATMRTYARNNGTELLPYEYYKWIMYWLPVIEYSTFNMQQPFVEELTEEGYHQGGLGPGLTNINGSHWSNFNGYYPLTVCGFGYNLGNKTGVKNITIPASGSYEAETLQVCRYRGFDNIFGDIWTNIEGFIANHNTTNGLSNIYTTTNPSDYNDSDTTNYKFTGYQDQRSGYIQEFDLQNTAEIIPYIIDGKEPVTPRPENPEAAISYIAPLNELEDEEMPEFYGDIKAAATYKCDYGYSPGKTSTLCTLFVGGRADYGANAGLGSFDSCNSVGGSRTSVGFRTYSLVE